MNHRTTRSRTAVVAAVLLGVLCTASATAWAATDPLDRNADLHASVRAQARALVFDHLAIRAEIPRRVPDEVVYRLKGDRERFRVKKVQDVDQALADMQRDPAVLYAEPNVIATISEVPNDPYYPLQWHLDSSAQGGVGAEEAWEVNAGEGVTVAVIDTGVAYENYTTGSWFSRQSYYKAPDLGNTCFVPGYDYINNDSHPNDDHSHGTHVAGTIAQTTGNSTGVAGLAHGACIMPLKALDANGTGSHTAIAQAIYFAADHGADVISMSLGSSAGTQTLYDAVAYAYGKGVTIVAASGNEGASVSYPAAYDDFVIAVGATRYDETLTSYSNRGPSIDLVAPGGDLTVDQNGDGYVDGVLQQTFNPTTKVRNEWGYYFFQGTSMATPHVAAAAAMVRAQGEATTPDAVRAALESSADDLGTLGRDELYGQGLIDVPAALAWTAGPVDAVPSVRIIEPSTDAVVAGLVSVVVDAHDDSAIVSATLMAPDAPYALTQAEAADRYHADWNSLNVDDGVYELEVAVVDSAGQSASTSVRVVVDNENVAPVANAGADQTLEVVAGGTVAVTLDGGASYDADPVDFLSYMWYREGEEIALCESKTCADALGVGTYTYQLEVRDQRGGVSEDLVTVSVSEKVVPAITLSVRGYKVLNRMRADLSWSGALGALTDVYRDGTRITTTSNDGFYTDKINLRGSGTFIYRVCEAGSATNCSLPVSVTIL